MIPWMCCASCRVGTSRLTCLLAGRGLGEALRDTVLAIMILSLDKALFIRSGRFGG